MFSKILSIDEWAQSYKYTKKNRVYCFIILCSKIKYIYFINKNFIDILQQYLRIVQARLHVFHKLLFHYYQTIQFLS